MRRIKLFSIIGLICLFFFIGGDFDNDIVLVDETKDYIVEEQVNAKNIPQERVQGSKLISYNLYRTNAEKLKKRGM